MSHAPNRFRYLSVSRHTQSPWGRYTPIKKKTPVVRGELSVSTEIDMAHIFFFSPSPHSSATPGRVDRAVQRHSIRGRCDDAVVYAAGCILLSAKWTRSRVAPGYVALIEQPLVSDTRFLFFCPCFDRHAALCASFVVALCFHIVFFMLPFCYLYASFICFLSVSLFPLMFSSERKIKKEETERTGMAEKVQ